MAEFIRSIDDIVGHKYTVNYLKSRIELDNVPDVILFNGNSGVGKTSLAKVLAIAVNGNKPSLYEPVIDKNESVDCIKYFNMSNIGDDTDSVVSELQSAAFSSTGRKVIILDEVHGMTKKAQDAVMGPMEYLPEGIYIFLCTTEVSMLRAGLIGRCTQLNLNNLSYDEAKQVIKRKIISRDLSFELPQDMILNLIATWSDNQPRMAVNLLESFEVGRKITTDDLNAFISTNNVSIVVSMMEYLYGSLTKGIEFVSTLTISNDLLSSMIEVLKVALGHNSPLVSQDNTRVISKFFAGKDVTNFLMFVTKVNSVEYISRRVFTSKFIEHHTSIFNGVQTNFTPTHDIVKVMQADTQTIGDNAIERLREDSSLQTSLDRELGQAVSIEALFNLGKPVE